MSITLDGMTQERLNGTASAVWALAGQVVASMQTLDHETERSEEDLAEALRRLALLETTVEEARLACITRMRNLGASWTVIGDALGVSRQAAQQKFGEEVK